MTNDFKTKVEDEFRTIAKREPTNDEKASIQNDSLLLVRALIKKVEELDNRLKIVEDLTKKP